MELFTDTASTWATILMPLPTEVLDKSDCWLHVYVVRKQGAEIKTTGKEIKMWTLKPMGLDSSRWSYSGHQSSAFHCPPSSMLDFEDDEAEGNAQIFNLHLCLQRLLDKYFNDSVSTLVRQILPSESPTLRRRRKRRRAQQVFQDKKPRAINAAVHSWAQPNPQGLNLTQNTCDTSSFGIVAVASQTCPENGVHRERAAAQTCALYNDIINGGGIGSKCNQLFIEA